MKKLITLLLLFPLLLNAQIYVDNNWKNAINPTFQNLDKTKIQSGLLLDYAMDYLTIKDLNLKKGHYILNVQTASGKSKREIIIVK